MLEDLNVVIAGAAGEGVQTVGEVLAETIAGHGYAVFAWQEFESRIRGGQNSYSIRISEKPVNAPAMKADILLALNDGAAIKYGPLIQKEGILIAEKKVRDRMIPIAFSDIAKTELGNKIYGNTMALGALAAAIGMNLEILHAVLAHKFAQKGDPVVAANRIAAEKGYLLAREGCEGICPWKLPERDTRYRLISGTKALGLAAVLAGCRFIAAYPMSPATDTITFLAENEKEFEVFTEQAEDEISAVNMAIGASFAGARAMTATSGGGFALMVEAVSLAGMIETPLVIVLGQRPGPATGLPTRTAQGDLLFAVHAGHGEFPKLVLAPADAKDIFRQTVRAFNLADRYQIPAVVLTDQFLLDSLFSVEDLRLEQYAPEFHLADPSGIDDYHRYQASETGISPRLYPGQARHLVTADSDEHDSRGHITEDLAGTVPAMVEKRLAKHRELKAAIRPPEEIDVEKAERILVGWGSSRPALLEALERLRKNGTRTGMIHFTEMWPLPAYRFPEGKAYWSVENNATGQLARLLRSEYGITFSGEVHRYDGLPLTGPYIQEALKMVKIDDFKNDVPVQWCPGCPNFSILNAIKTALVTLEKQPSACCLVSGIGQATKLPHYLNCNFFNGLHGRAIPAALGIHVANPRLTTLVVTGEGDCYGEGGNHFLHALRRNPDITVVVHNNGFYALTKGQASPTTGVGEKRSLQIHGVEIAPLNMPAIAIVHDCTFVARGFAGDGDHLKSLLTEAISHPGLSVVEVIQPCITWGTHPVSWYRERVYALGDDYDPADRKAALEKTMETEERIATGILYRTVPRKLFADRFRKEITDRPFAELKPVSPEKISGFMSGLR